MKTKPLLHFRYLCIVLPFLLLACSKSDLPEYWACEGSTQQVLRSSGGVVLESYSGDTKLLLESYHGGITQYVSKPFTGVFQECVNNDQIISFRLGNCNEQSMNGGHSAEGELLKSTGKLVMTSRRMISQGIVSDQGSFQCQYLGSQISAEIFE